VRAARAADTIDSLVFDSDQPGAVTKIDAEKLGAIGTNQHRANRDWAEQWGTLLAVHTSRGVFLISQLQPAGKRTMSAEEFLRGHALEAGCKFLLPEPARERLHR
jgi:methionyl-tRNA formyltransferase